MAQSSEGQGSLTAADEREACYVYCIVPAGEAVGLGPIGIEEREVYALVHGGLGALVHDCPAQPYNTKDRELATGWVLAHHRVVAAAWKRWGTVLPLTFNTLIARGEVGAVLSASVERTLPTCRDSESLPALSPSNGSKGADDNLVAWLEREHKPLVAKLDALAGKAEYGVQVFWDAAYFAQQAAEASPEIIKLRNEIRGQPRGLAYMYSQRLEALLRQEVEAQASVEFRDLYARLSRYADNIRIEKTGKGDGERPMLMNLSCLVSSQRYPDLVAELDNISQRQGLSLRLAGPWPPYSFC